MEIAQRTPAVRLSDCFNNAYKVALLVYVCTRFFFRWMWGPVYTEYAWIGFDDQIVDPTLPFGTKMSHNLLILLSGNTKEVQQLTATVEEARRLSRRRDPSVYGSRALRVLRRNNVKSIDYLMPIAIATIE